MPWRKTKDPYPVWLSEIILQQTRVDQGLPYWERFMEEFPTVDDLAKASQEKVLRLWQGLGYYSRARNLQAAAKFITQDKNGNFPSTYNEILKLKGVGPYTAAAIASICFDEPRPVVDGNVFRFASRYLGITDDTSKSGTRRVFEDALGKMIPQEAPGEFNQAMMEFGASVCTPSPKCEECLFNLDCYAFRNKKQKDLPVKTAKTKVRDRYFHYLVLKCNEHHFLKQRNEKDVWSGLFDFLLFEGEQSEESVLKKFSEELKLPGFTIENISETILHILSHQKIHARFYEISISQKAAETLKQNTALKPYSKEEVLNLPKPKLIVNYLQRTGIS